MTSLKIPPFFRALGLTALLQTCATGQTIYSDPADLSLRLDRTDGVTVSSNGPGETALSVGKSGSAAGFDRAAVVVFQLPDLGDVANPFGSATLGLYMTQDSVTTAVNGDLYGMPRRDVPDVQLTDYFGRELGPDPTDATLLQDNFLTADGLTLNSLVETSAVGTSNLTAFLNEQYEGGAGIGQYLLFRINTDADTTQRWSFTSTEGANGDLSQTPQISYVVASAPVDTIRVETAGDGSGIVIPDQTLIAGETLTTFAVGRDGAGGFTENVPVTWTLSNLTGDIDQADLVISEDNLSATFNAGAPGTATITVAGNAANFISSGTLTVIAGAASQVFVEDAPDGTGAVFADQPLLIPVNLTAFAITRDDAGNFIESVPAAWTLVDATGEILPDNLVAAADGLSANFATSGVGTTKIRATVAGLTSVDSGVIEAQELLARWDGGGPNSSWDFAANWFADTLPEFTNTTDLIFYDAANARFNIYLASDRTARTLTYDEDADQNFNIRFTQTGLTGAVNLILDTDSTTEPAMITVDADAAGTFRLGNIPAVSSNEYGSLVLADDLLVTHDGTGTLIFDGNITETEGPHTITKAGTGTATMTGVNSYTGDTRVTAGVLGINGTSLPDEGNLVIDGGVVQADGEETVGNLFFGDVRQPAGIYGSSLSAAPFDNQDDTRFSGTGTVTSLGVSRGNIVITDISVTGTDIVITWQSNPGDFYTLVYSNDLIDFSRDLEDGIAASANGTTTSFSFSTNNLGLDSEKAFFRVFRN